GFTHKHAVRGGGQASLKKQLVAPVWQAGPCGWTRSRIASRSQSRRRSTTSIRFPEVAPFSQSPRVREWNQACPVSTVLRQDSPSSQASIKTWPVSASCTTAGSRPLEKSGSPSPITSSALYWQRALRPKLRRKGPSAPDKKKSGPIKHAL